MLVLSRKVNEKILIGNDTELVIVDIRGDSVRVGITAPKDVVILREEVRDRRINDATGDK